MAAMCNVIDLSIERYGIVLKRSRKLWASEAETMIICLVELLVASQGIATTTRLTKNTLNLTKFYRSVEKFWT